MEKVNVAALKSYIKTNSDRRNSQVIEYVKQIDNGGDMREWNVNYTKCSTGKDYELTYHRLFGSGLCLQKLTKEARCVATRGHGIEIDMMNAQPQLFLNLLKSLDGYDKEHFSMLQKYCSHFKNYRRFISEYFDLPLGKAKTKMIQLFYGYISCGDIPFIRKLADEINFGIDQLL